ncbi:MAG: ATP-binding cassette domain-containing protein [Acidobacteriota bacterium]|nr:ATP-binding cassette domain-containing protein [Acidobacteriota bacterium]
MTETQGKHRFFAPEVIQTSAMDCGPASLKCLMDGFGLHADYGRLREACQTDVDGTSIDTIEDTANRLGLRAFQRLLPLDHLFVPDMNYLPAMVVVRLPNGFTHFVVVWRRFGNFVQVMDPGTGRRWESISSFMRHVFVHRHPLAAEDWRDWAGTDDFLGPLELRMTRLGCRTDFCKRRIETALTDPSWFGIAALDAAVRMVHKLVDARALKPAATQERLLDRILERALAEEPGEMHTIPEPYWCLVPTEEGEGEDLMAFRGVVILDIRGKSADLPAEEDEEQPQPLSEDLSAVLREDKTQHFSQVLKFIKGEGLLAPVFLLAAMLLATFSRLVEVALFRVFLELNEALAQPLQRLGAVGYVLAFAAALLLLELPIANILLRLGRHLETGLRLSFLRKLPRIGDRYFHSRPVSDMADRAHRVFSLRHMSTLGGSLVRTVLEMALTVAGILWIDPELWPYTLLLAATALGFPLAAQPVLNEQNLRVLTHGGALSRFYLESFMGLIPIRAHGAEQAVRREQEKLLVEWVHASTRYLRSTTLVNALVAFSGIVLTIAVIFSHLARHTESGLVLLLIYWVLQLPRMGNDAARVLLMVPNQRNTAMRLFEPLSAPEEDVSTTRDTQPEPDLPNGMSVSMEDVDVVAGGRLILSHIDLKIEPGEHLAIVGRSGAGKSTLVGLLLGWTQPAEGKILVDGRELKGSELERVRGQTTWVDPAVHLWNDSLIENLAYGAPDRAEAPLEIILDQADLLNLLDAMPDGLRTVLGESGALVSGGEGQRVRLGRALQRKQARLVILDEPFRGLDRPTRARLMDRAHAFWPNATLICITHDLQLTDRFSRVLVIEDGQIREDGSPQSLLKQNGRYAELFNGDRELWKTYWQDTSWRRVTIASGTLTEQPEVDA